MFFIVVKALRNFFGNAKSSGSYNGVPVSIHEAISHVLFIDDVLYFSNGPLRDISSLKYMLSLYYKVTRMEINYDE